MKLFGFDRVLCLSPHPDDVELGMSGTIEKYWGTTFRIICCSVGTQSDGSSGIHRHDEISAFWSRLPFAKAELHFVDDFINLHREDEWVAFIEKEFLEGCQAVFTVSGIDSHFEHRIVSNVAEALVRHQVLSLIQYRSFSTLREWVPNFFVDITRGYERKMNALEEIKSQLGKTYFKQEILDAAHTEMQCAKRLLSRIEQFRIVTLYE